MRRLLWCPVLLWGMFVCAHAFAQKSTPIRCTADLLQFDNGFFPDAQVFTGNVEFSHEESTGYADTVFYYEKANRIEATGKELIIHINDSVHLYGKTLRYDGNSRIAVLEGNVMLFDNYSVLYTDRLVFYRDDHCAFYEHGGRIVSDSAEMTSEQGYYHTNTKDAYFRREVRVRHPDFSMEADSLRYNTQQKVVYFIGPTRMYADSDFVYTESGKFVTRTEEAELYGRSKVYSAKHFLTADTICFDHLKDAGKAWSRVFLQDTCEKHFISGHYLEYDGGKGYVFATEKAMAVYVQEKDSLFLHADTLWVHLDSHKRMSGAEAYPQLRFFHPAYQGRCGRLTYSAADSVAEMTLGPLFWNDSTQLSADTFRLYMQGRQWKEARLLRHAFAGQNVLCETRFNQLKGDAMYVYFKDNRLDYMWVYPRAHCLYYIQEEDSSLIGVHQVEAEKMRVVFDSSEMSSIVFYRQVKGTFAPEEEDKRFLPGFQWFSIHRPVDRDAIFEKDTYVPARWEDEENADYEDDEDE
ncbi:MAG: hypothetical protein J5873_06045 [Bacteroidales bacterium]|nr:hypothetical protein [Bacteroidales bacterium]